MEYRTKATLVAHLESAAEVFIFIPPLEDVETSSEPDLKGKIQVKWRGSRLTVGEHELADAVQPVA